MSRAADRLGTPRTPAAPATGVPGAPSLSLRPTRRAPAARTLAARRSAFEQRVDEAVGVEGGEIVHPLAEAHHLHRDAELALHVDDDAALGGAVELGQDDAGDVHRLREDPGLLHAVLAGGRV